VTLSGNLLATIAGWAHRDRTSPTRGYCWGCKTKATEIPQIRASPSVANLHFIMIPVTHRRIFCRGSWLHGGGLGLVGVGAKPDRTESSWRDGLRRRSPPQKASGNLARSFQLENSGACPPSRTRCQLGTLCIEAHELEIIKKEIRS
jgi:hypothetical protein